MAVNISKILVELLKGNIFDLVECCLSLSDVFYFGSIYVFILLIYTLLEIKEKK